MFAHAHQAVFTRVFATCVLGALLALALGAAPAAADDPNGAYEATTTPLSGDHTYAQVHATHTPFTFENGTLTLTGNMNNVLVNTTLRNFTFNVSSDNGNATLVLQKGTFTGRLHLAGNSNASVLRVGSGTAGASRDTVTITGAVGGANNGTSHIITDGANLVINGSVGEPQWVGQAYANNGNITLNGSDQNQIGVIRANPDMQLYSESRLVIYKDLDLQPNSSVISNSEIHLYQGIGYDATTGYRMREGSLLSARNDISFVNHDSSQPGGIHNASGTIRAGGSIGPLGAAPAYNITQGSDPLYLVAGGSIGAGEITADTIRAGGSVVAGVRDPDSLANSKGWYSITPSKTITASHITAGLLAAGEIKVDPDANGSASVVAQQLLVAKREIAGGSTGTDTTGDGSKIDTSSTGDFTLNNGTFRLTGTGSIGNSGYDDSGALVSHSEASYVGGNMDVKNSGASSFTTLGVGGDVNIEGGSLSGTTLNAASVTLHDGINAGIGTVSLASGAMQVGADDDTAPVTDVRIGTLRVNGQDLLVGNSAGQARAAVGSVVAANGTSGLADGNVTVGTGGMLAVGASDTAALQAMAAAAGMPAGSAVLGVFSPLVLGRNLTVDHRTGISSAAGNGVKFSGNSLLVIDGGKAGVNYANPPVPTRALPAAVPGAISATSAKTATVESGAKIYIDHVTPGHTYVALGKNITTNYADDTAWKGANLLSSNPLLELTRLGGGMEGQFSVTEKAPDIKHVGVTGGVPRLSRAASETMEQAIYSRIKLGEEDLYRRNFALWALPLYESIDHFGFDGGPVSYGYRGGIGGLAVGADYTWENTLRAGISLNMGTGYVKSTGETETTHNRANFWGVGAYGVWKPGAFSLDADLNWTSVYNKVTQDLPAGLPASEVKADIRAWSLGMSLRGEYEIDTRYVDMRAHLGVRYLHVQSAPFDVSMLGEDVLHGNTMYQNVWTFPFGMVFTKAYKLENGWEITPLVNLKAIPALGDTYARTSVKYAGAHTDTEFDTQVMDDITWGGRAGVEFRAGNFTTGINYTAQFGVHTANQGVFGVLRYEF